MLVYPELPEGLFWSIDPYVVEDEYYSYRKGEAVTVGIRKEGKFFGFPTKFRFRGPVVRIVQNIHGEEGLQEAINDVYESYVRFINRDKTYSDM